MEAEATDQGDGGNNDYLENYIHGGHHAILPGTLWSSSQIPAPLPISDLSNIPPSRSTRSHVSAGSDGDAGTAAMATSDDPVNTLKIRTHPTNPPRPCIMQRLVSHLATPVLGSAPASRSMSGLT